jgi:hypothetical protein
MVEYSVATLDHDTVVAHVRMPGWRLYYEQAHGPLPAVIRFSSSSTWGASTHFSLTYHDYINDSSQKNRHHSFAFRALTSTAHFPRPRPGLNSLANHGYLPRDGRNIHVTDIVTAMDKHLGVAVSS